MADLAAPFRISGETGEWEVVVGLEVHAQITATASKLFSGAATAFGAEPNTQVSLVDAAMPGMLPVPNRECIRQAVRTGMALDARINDWSAGSTGRITSTRTCRTAIRSASSIHPIVGEGEVEILLDDKDESSARRIGIERIHVEQDAGKLMHDQHPTMSYVDLNRCRRRADGDRVQARHAFACRGRRLSAQAARDPPLRRLVRRQYGRRARCAPTSTSACGKPGRAARHEDRDQERQFGALRHGRDRA